MFLVWPPEHDRSMRSATGRLALLISATSERWQPPSSVPGSYTLVLSTWQLGPAGWHARSVPSLSPAGESELPFQRPASPEM